MLCIGLMSGTSMDGIDVALLETDGTPDLIIDRGFASIAYELPFKILLKAAEYGVRKYQGQITLAKAHFNQDLQEYLIHELCIPQDHIAKRIEALATYLHGSPQTITLDDIVTHSTELHAQVVEKLLTQLKIANNDIDVVGYHGQTLYHQPAMKTSVVIGDGQYLADRLGIAVVNDFRSRDVACGGQGAPFAPIYHQALAIRDGKLPLAVVNCGGISNITIIQNQNELELIGFDTGPGNALIDRWIRQHSHGIENMDENGKYGLQGKVNPAVLAALHEKAIIKNGQNYLHMLPPKSLDYGDMCLIAELNALSFADACRTLEAFTADSIVQSLTLLNGKIPNYWILAGGGWNNPVITQELQQRLEQKIGSSLKLETAAQAGWNNQALEAQIFAYLAVRSLQNKPLSVPGTTQVSRPLSGGHAYLPKQGASGSVRQLIEANPSVLNGYQEVSVYA